MSIITSRIRALPLVTIDWSKMTGDTYLLDPFEVPIFRLSIVNQLFLLNSMIIISIDDINNDIIPQNGRRTFYAQQCHSYSEGNVLLHKGTRIGITNTDIGNSGYVYISAYTYYRS